MELAALLGFACVQFCNGKFLCRKKNSCENNSKNTQ